MPDVVQVVVLTAGAHAFLARCSGVVGPPLASEKDVLELIHAGIDEEKRRVLGRNQRGALDDAMAAVFKEFEESPADFVTVHAVVLFPLEWPPPHIQDELKPEKDEPHHAIGAEDAISNRSF